MQQQINEAPIDTAAAQLPGSQAPAAAPHGRDTAALWRAMAGMAISVALACLIVMLEFTGQAARRADRINRHADGLLSKVSRLEDRIAAERARNAAAHREFAAVETLRALLRAPDAAMLSLSPPPAAGGNKVAPAPRPEAMLAFSPKEHRAVLMVTGLEPPANDALLVLWLSPLHGAPLRAAEFRTTADGSALLTAAWPPALEVTAATVTVERPAKGGAAKGAKGSAQAAPSGTVQLRGTLAR